MQSRLFTIVSILVFLSGCASTPAGFSNAAPGVDFSSYRTFGFLENMATDRGNYESLETSYLKVAVSQALSEHGMEYSSEPDLLVNFYIHTADKIRTRTVPTASAYYGWRDPFYDPWYGYGGYETRVDQYTEGTLNIDIVDAKANQLVWEGSISGRITDKDIRNMEQTIDGAVAVVMANFPN